MKFNLYFLYKVAVVKMIVCVCANLSFAKSTHQESAIAKSVSHEDILNGTNEGSQWLTFGGSYDNSRFSPLADIHRKNVKDLKLVGQFVAKVPGPMETSPIVVDGKMYITTGNNHVYALDAKTAKVIWHYEYKPDVAAALLCCGSINRGLAIAGDKLYMATLDARLIAINRFTGEEDLRLPLNVSENGVVDVGASFTSAPLIIKNLAIVGSAGGEFASHGFIAAVDIQAPVPKIVWKIYTVPTRAEAPGADTWADGSWKYGGAPAWTTGTYDEQTGLLYWTTGNPGLDWHSSQRKGDNLYSDSVLALNPQTGEMKWYFQFTPHDIWDFDATNSVVVTDINIEGTKRRVLLQPNRNGYVYVLDAVTGQFLRGHQYTDRLNWSQGLTREGRPMVTPGFERNNHDNMIYPGILGGNNGAFSWAYNKMTRLMYIPVIESGVVLKETEVEEGQEVPCEKGPAACVGGFPVNNGSTRVGPDEPEETRPYGKLTAFDPEKGTVRWQYRDQYPLMGGALATAGGLVFSGNLSGQFFALDDWTGEVLWQFQTRSAMRGHPITYKIDGRQYVVIPSGGGGIAQFLAGQPTEGIDAENSYVMVFALP